jgi:hypothetical protein
VYEAVVIHRPDPVDTRAIALVAGCAFVLGCFQLYSMDAWHNLRAGQWIVEHGGLPFEEPFTVLGEGRRWVYHEWLFGLVTYSIWTLGGFEALTIAKSAWLSLAAAVLYGLARQRGAAPLVAAAFVVVACIGARFRFNLRPHLILFLLAPLTLVVIDLARKRDPRWLFVLPLIQVMWANTHGSFTLGLVLVVLAWCSDLIARRGWVPGILDPPPVGKAWIWPVALLATAAAPLLNPWGVDLILTPLRIESMAATQGRITEWLPASPPDWLGVPALWLVLAAFFGIVQWRGKKLDLFELAVLAFCIGLAFRAIRFHALFVLIGGAILAGWCPSALLRRVVAARASWIAWALVPSAAATAIVLNPFFKPGTGLHEALYPSTLSDVVADLETPGPVAVPFVWGGYFVWSHAPERKILWDGRADAFDQTALAALMDGDATEWHRVIQQKNINVAVILRKADGNPDPPMLLTGWSLVFWDDMGEVWLRNGDVAAPEITRRALRHIGPPQYLTHAPPRTPAACEELESLMEQSPRHATSAAWAGRCRAGLSPPDLEAAEAHLRRSLAVNESAGNNNDLGIVLQLAGADDDALMAFAKATGLDPEYAEAWYNRGNLLWNIQRRADAAASYERFLDLAPPEWADARRLAESRTATPAGTAPD